MPTKPLSRRNFLKAAGLTLAATSVTFSGLGYAASRTPQFDTPELIFGKDNPMNNRILVTYATRAGSTVEVANAIAEALSKRGYQVEVKPVKARPSLNEYQAVILGSAIRMGGWLPEMLSFIKSNQAALNALPAALFTVHMLNAGDDEASRLARSAYTAPVHNLLTPAGETFFRGKMDYSKLSFFDRLLAQAVEKQTGTPTGDFRDWEKIRGWANTVLS